MSENEATLRWMREYHPEILAMRDKPHAFVPLASGQSPDHVCGPRCYCEVCWEPKSRRVHRRTG